MKAAASEAAHGRPGGGESLASELLVAAGIPIQLPEGQELVDRLEEIVSLIREAQGEA